MSDMAPVDPHDFVGYAIVVAGAAFTTFSFVAAFVWSIRPGERNADHPKNLIFRDDR